MNAILRAEAIKMRSLRSTWASLLLVVTLTAALISLVGILSGTHRNPSLGTDDLPDLLAVPAMLTCGIVLVLSILTTAGEFRTGAINGSLLVTPRRERFIAGKLVSAALLGVALAATAVVAAYLATAVVVVARDLPVDLVTTDAAVTSLGILFVAALFGVAGSAVGTLVRNQAVAVVAALAWWFVIENAMPGLVRVPEMAKYLPMATARTLVQAGSPSETNVLGPTAAALLLTGYVAAISLGAAAMLRRRDVN